MELPVRDLARLAVRVHDSTRPSDEEASTFVHARARARHNARDVSTVPGASPVSARVLVFSESVEHATVMLRAYNAGLVRAERAIDSLLHGRWHKYRADGRYVTKRHRRICAQTGHFMNGGRFTCQRCLEEIR